MPPATLTTVLFAPRSVRTGVNRLRAAAPPSGVPVMDAHVTVKGTFVRMTPEDALALIQRVCTHVPPIPLQCQGLQAWFRMNDESVSLVVPVWQHPDLLRLHDALHSALGDPDRTLYRGDKSHWYSPHLTIVQQIPRARLAEALAVLPAPQWSFLATDVALMRQETDLSWREVGRAPLTGERDGIGTL
jgi:2'-5' RNA ligase